MYIHIILCELCKCVFHLKATLQVNLNVCIIRQHITVIDVLKSHNMCSRIEMKKAIRKLSKLNEMRGGTK